MLDLKKIDYKKLLFYATVPLVLGGIVGLINSGSFSSYDGFVPAILFPIVWSILYILMGISSYLVRDNEKLMNIYKVNLAVNLIWPFLFFFFNLRVLAFFWILILIVVIGYMMYEFYKESKLAFYLLIPYLLWTIFASVLNLMEII